MTEFNFDNAEFNANDFEEETLDMQDGMEIDSDFMTFDDPNEISMNVSIRNKSAEETAGEVESTLLELMASGDSDVILALTGESHESSAIIDPNIASKFSALYTTAAGFNPAIRWYSKLAKMLPAEKFSVGDTGLTLKMSESLFKKAVAPFLGDFKAELRESSPIVSLIYSIGESIGDKAVQDQVSRALEQDGREADPDQMDIAEVDMEENMFDTEDVQVGEVHVDDSTELGLTEVNRTETPSISLTDLANKTIAEHFIDNDQTDPDSVRQKLVSEGFKNTRINEILGIIKFIRLNATMDGRVTPAGNIGAGDVDFDFM